MLYLMVEHGEIHSKENEKIRTFVEELPDHCTGVLSRVENDPEKEKDKQNHRRCFKKIVDYLGENLEIVEMLSGNLTGPRLVGDKLTDVKKIVEGLDFPVPDKMAQIKEALKKSATR